MPVYFKYVIFPLSAIKTTPLKPFLIQESITLFTGDGGCDAKCKDEEDWGCDCNDDWDKKKRAIRRATVFVIIFFHKPSMAGSK